MGCFHSKKWEERGNTKPPERKHRNSKSSSGTKNSTPRSSKNRKPDRRSNEKYFSPRELKYSAETSEQKEKVNIGSEEMEINAPRFTFEQMQDATEDFRKELTLGEGGFGKVYRGRLLDKGQIVAVKRLNKGGMQGEKEFLAELATLSRADHPNLVKLLGYCSQGQERLLIYEYMPYGSLDDHLHELDWNARVKVAAGAACGLEYLHNKLDPHTIHRDLKCSNILLELNNDSKLSDFGLSKEGPTGDKTHVSTRIMGTPGYVAPEYLNSGHLTFETDVYSFGVLLLEIITGRQAYDKTRDADERNLGSWALSLLKDKNKGTYYQMADPTLRGQYPKRGLQQFIAIAASCVDEQPSRRPVIASIVEALEYIERQIYDPHAKVTQSLQEASTSSSVPKTKRAENLEVDATSSPTSQAQSAQGSNRDTSSAPQPQPPQGSQGDPSSPISN